MPKTVEGILDDERRVAYRACGKCVPRICQEIEDQANRNSRSFSREEGFVDLTRFAKGELYDFYASYVKRGREEVSHFQTEVTIWGTGHSVKHIDQLVEEFRKNLAERLEQVKSEERRYTYRAGDDGWIMRQRVTR